MNNTKTHIAKITLSRKDLLYDIKNRAYIIGDTMSEDQEHFKHQTTDIGQDGNVDFVTRILDVAHAECAEWLFAYTKVPCEEISEYDNGLREEETYVINMVVPDGMSQTTLDLISKLIHEYMVLLVLGRWMHLVGLSSERWEVQAEKIKSQIASRLNARWKRVRLKQHPF